MKPYFVLTGMLLAALGSAQADTFRWVDKSGVVHYGDVPAEEAAQVEQKKFHVAPEVGDASLSYETRVVQQNFPVTLYVASNCKEPCQQGRDLLNKRGIPFTEKNLVTQEDIDAFKLKSGGSTTVPTLNVGKTWLNNFEAGQWSSELDAAGYPKIAPYRPPAPPTATPDKPARNNE
jgi:glutaredoxin